MVAPFLVVVGLLVKGQRPFLASALLLMVLGTAGAWLAVATGNSAGELAERLPGVKAVLERHEEMAETTRTVFTVLTLVFASLVVVPWALKQEPPRLVRLGAHAVFLAVYAGVLFYLASAAHEGGRLVHEMGVHALVAHTGPANAVGPAGPGEKPGAGRARVSDDD
jgi:uncharacterized membrane protein